MASGTLIVHQRHAKGKFSYIPPLFIVYPETVYIDASADISFGRGVDISRGVTILTHEHDHSKGVLIEDSAVELIPLEIGDGVFIGVNALIAPMVRKIGAHAVIGAGSVLTKDVGENEIWAGNPARFIKMRT